MTNNCHLIMYNISISIKLSIVQYSSTITMVFQHWQEMDMSTEFQLAS